MADIKEHSNTGDFVILAGVIGALFLATLVLVLVFAEGMLVFVLTTVVWAFVVLGIVLGIFMLKAKTKE